MKPTRKQKLQRRKERRQRSDDRKFAIVERILEMIGITQVFSPFARELREGVVLCINPRMVVEASDESQRDPLVASVCADIEEIIETPQTIMLGDRTVEITLEEFLRGYLPIAHFVSTIAAVLNESRSEIRRDILDRINETMKRIAEFEEGEIDDVLRVLICDVHAVAADYLRIDEQIVWYEIDCSENSASRQAFRIVVAKKKPAPVSLAVSEGARKAYPCECAKAGGGLQRMTWNPAELGISDDDRDLPVFVGTHAIERLQERIPLAPMLGMLHGLLCDAMEAPRLHPREGAGGFLVEVGVPGRKLGYFVAELYPEFVYVRTFLFLTMQGTPEAECLRQKLRLSRSEIEYYKLDNYFTFTMSDLGEDRELRNALAQCNCAHLLDFADTSRPLAWRERFSAPFRKKVGLSLEGLTNEAQAKDRAEEVGIEGFTDQCRKLLKKMRGWIVE